MTGENGGPGLRPRRLVEETATTTEPARTGGSGGFGRRASALLSSAWTAVRPTRNRSTGYIAIGAVGALIGTSVAVGVGTSGSVPEIADIGAWLSNSDKGSAAHANGLTGEVDGKVELPTGKHPVSISQDGKTVLVLDKKTGKVIRVDPSQLTAEESTSYSSSDLQLVAGGAFAYVVNPVKGTVQRIDPVRTSPIGAPVDLGTKPLGEAVVDPQGTLWVPEPTKGEVVPFPGGRRGKPLNVAKPGHNLTLTVANGKPVVTDTSAARLTLLELRGPGLTVNLGSFIDKASPETVLVPSATDGDVVPVLAAETGRMTLVDIRTGGLRNAALGVAESAYEAPQVLGTHVYVPDRSGELKVYDTADAAVREPIKVTDKPGDLEVFVRNGLLWVNDSDNKAAAVIDAGGKTRKIGKYKDDAPSARKPEKDTPPERDNTPDQPVPPVNPDPPAPPVNDPPKQDLPEKPEKPERPEKDEPKAPVPPSKDTPDPEPSAPGTPQTEAGADGITVSFSPASGSLKPTGYTLQGVPAGATAAPATVAADGPFQFQVSGLSCGTEYSFTVVARFAGGQTRESGASTPMRPCTAPAAPRNLQITYPQGGHGANVSWQAPANASGTMSYTVTWNGGSKQVTGTSLAVTGLTNGQQYTISVTSANEAGGGAAANGTADLTPPAQTMNIAHNDDDTEPLYVRSEASTQSGYRVTSVAGKTTPAVTVLCNVPNGSNETHPYDNVSSPYWGKITVNGKTGYVADIYLDSRNNPNVWNCT